MYQLFNSIMKNRKATIHDIAKALNLDSSTVSRALNDSGRVTVKTKKKVLEKASELDYKKNKLALSLRKNKTNTIGVIVPRVSRFLFSSAIEGIEETAFREGYNIIICQSLEQLIREENIVENLLAYRVDGVLISVSMETRDYNHLEKLTSAGVPFVIFDRHCDLENNFSVVLDDYKAGYHATSHLINMGKRVIAHYSGPLDFELYQNRLLGYKSALEDNNLPYLEELVFYSNLMSEDGVENIKKIMSLPYKVDAIFSANDIAAISTIQYLKKIKVAIPEDIAIVGCSNEPMSEIIDPALTTVNQTGFKMGELATSLILKLVENSTFISGTQTILIEPELIIRASSQNHVKLHQN
jgi:LacI family transcriptional regulator